MIKKILVILGLAAVCFSLFAQSESSKIPSSNDGIPAAQYDAMEKKTEVIIPKEQHLKDETANVKIEYMPLYDEVRIYYESMYVTYDRSEAMETIIQCLDDFQREHKYFSYKYLRDDKERFFKDEKGRRKAQYISTVKFSR